MLDSFCCYVSADIWKCGRALVISFFASLTNKIHKHLLLGQIKLQNQSPGRKKKAHQKNKQTHTHKKNLWLLVLIIPPKIFFDLTEVCE